MTPASSRTVVLVSGGLMLTFVALQPGPKYRRAWAAGVITLGLSVASDLVPEIAGPFAILVVLALAARQRGTLGKLIGATPPPSSNSAPAATHGAAPSAGATIHGSHGSAP